MINFQIDAETNAAKNSIYLKID